MMATADKSRTRGASSGREKPGGKKPRAGSAAEKPTITAAQRWLKISRKVQAKARQRGFVGGDPLEDFSEAIAEVDNEYATDVRGLLALTDPKEMVEQFQSLFAGYGLGKQGLDRLLALNRDALEKLATSNRDLIKRGSVGAMRGSSLLRSAAEDAIQTLQSVADGATRIEERLHLPTKPTRAFSHMLARLAALADSTDALDEEPVRLPATAIHGAVVKAYEGYTAEELAEAPITALKGISEESGALLEQAFGIESIRDMAASRLAERAEGIVTLADQEEADSVADEGSLRDLAAGPVARLEGISAEQATALDDALRIKSVRDLARNRFFRIARAVVTLADIATEESG